MPSRYSVIDAPVLFPGQTLLSRTAGIKNGPYVDAGAEISHDGRVYFSFQEIEEMYRVMQEYKGTQEPVKETIPDEPPLSPKLQITDLTVEDLREIIQGELSHACNTGNYTLVPTDNIVGSGFAIEADKKSDALDDLTSGEGLADLLRTTTGAGKSAGTAKSK